MDANEMMASSKWTCGHKADWPDCVMPKPSLASVALQWRWSVLKPWDDANVWEMIASGGVVPVHHIESPAHDSEFVPHDKCARIDG